MTLDIGPFGVFSASSAWRGEPEVVAEAAARLEDDGWGALWLAGAAGHLLRVESILAASRSLVVATGIVSIWDQPAEDLIAAYRRIDADRLLLGLGISHPRVAAAYRKPFASMVEYLDQLGDDIPPQKLALAALGPKMLDLAARRSAGAYTYLVTPEHTAKARATMGTGPLLAAEHKVVLTTDPAKARELARPVVGFYLTLPNYANNLRRLGWSDEDLAGTGSNRLLDALVAWGEPDAIAKRLREHLDAGANHVVVQILTGDTERRADNQWHEMAAALRS